MAAKPSVRTARPARSVLRKDSSFNRSRMIGSAESGYRPLRDIACRQGAKLAVWQDAGTGATTTDSRGCWEDSEDLDVHPRPISAPGCSGRTHRQRQLQRACRARARPDILADGAPLESRRRSTQGAPPAAGRCRRPVPGKHADITCQCLFLSCLSWLCQDLTTISPRHLDVVTVACLVQILGAQITPACATRRAPYHRPPLPGDPSHTVA